MRIPKFLLARIFFLLALLFSALVATGLLLLPTLRLEQWLMERPLTRVDCLFRVWEPLGQITISLPLVLLIGLFCLRLGYRRRILLSLSLLLLLSVGLEIVGKASIVQLVPNTIQRGIDVMDCPQVGRQYTTAGISLGLWWLAPTSSVQMRKELDHRAQSSLQFEKGSISYHGYPSGHAIRWLFIGLVSYWLVKKHMRRSLLRVPLLVLLLVVAFGGGFTLFYVGYHLATDTLGGYLFGASVTCVALGLLEREWIRFLQHQPAPVSKQKNSQDEYDPGS